VLNQPFSGRIAVVGGTPPYSFATFGELPAGLGAIDTNTGMVSGMPTTANAYQFTVLVKDSSSPPQSASQAFVMTVMPPVRNDTPATATSIPGNITVAGSISPYIDPPNDAPLAADTDYYKLVSFPGATVHVETTAKRTNSSNPLDTVIEIVDGNGIRLNNCRQPGDTSSTFTSSCINDDISDNPHVQDSALDFQVPGSNNSPTTFYVHVFDFRGDARPDMTYLLQVSGAMMPLTVAPSTLRPAARGNPYGGNVISQNGTGAVTWSLAPGSNLPPGLTLDNNGFVHGTPSTDGTFSFAVQVTDSGSPAQTATGQETIQVVEPITITSPATLPDACVNQPYIFVAQRTGGVPPTGWGLNNLPFAGLLLNFSSGVLSGTPTVTGTFTGTLSTSDATQTNASQQITLTVKQCP
jgi:hypothetical protein